MKLNFFMLAIALLASALIAYLFLEVSTGEIEDLRTKVLCCSGFVCFLTILIPLIGITYSDSRIALNVKVLSVCTLLLLICVHIPMVIYMYNPVYLIVPAGLILIIYIVVSNNIYRAIKIKNL